MLGPNEEEKMMNDELTPDLNDQNPIRGKFDLIYFLFSLNLVITFHMICLNFASWIRRFLIAVSLTVI